MNNENFNQDYTLSLLTQLWEGNPTMSYDTLDIWTNYLMHHPKHNCTIEQVKDFADSISKNISVIILRKDAEEQGMKTKKLYIFGEELTRDYYSLRTEAPLILRETAPTLYNKVKQGVIKTLPEFTTKKISAEEMYRYYCEYKR